MFDITTFKLRAAPWIFALFIAGSAWGQEEPVSSPALADLARRDPIAAAALELPRATPEQKMGTVAALLDLGYPREAAAIVSELSATQLDRNELAALVRTFGSSRFFELIRLASDAQQGEEFATAKTFGQQCLDAASEAARDPQQLARWVALAQLGDHAERRAARIDLRAAGAPAVDALVAGLARAKTRAERGALVAALVETGPSLAGPVEALLADARGTLRRDAVELAGHAGRPHWRPYLALLAFQGDDAAAAEAAHAALAKAGQRLSTTDQALQMVRGRIVDFERTLRAERSRAPSASNDGTTPTSGEPTSGGWWQWNQEKGELTSRAVAGSQLRILEAARLLRLQSELGIAADADRRRLLHYGLEAAETLGSQPMPTSVQQTLASATVEELNNALADAVRLNQHRAAARLAQEIGARGDASALTTFDGRPSSLAAAVNHPHRPLQFAALSAIMKIAPQHSFAGSSAVVEALWRFSLGAEKATALVAGPVAPRTSAWAGQLRGLGYDATPTYDGDQALRGVSEPTIHARLAVIVLDSDLNRPTIRETLYQLRSYPPTSGVPIALLVSPSKTLAMETLAAEHQGVLATPRVADAAGMASAVGRALALMPSAATSEEQLRSQSRQALAWLAQLSQDAGPYDELRRRAGLSAKALHAAETTEGGIALLAHLGTSQSQRDLVDFASRGDRPIAERQRAAAACASSVERFGVLLTRGQALTQYDRYNASERADAATQQVLGTILDAIERQ